MKLQDFGLWFLDWENNEWSTTIPPERSFDIIYDGQSVGTVRDNVLRIGFWVWMSHLIKLKKPFPYYRPNELIDYPLDFLIEGNGLTLEDFEIVENPLYREDLR